jgi:glycosyltransferase involved in cell wall biosynthesis
VLSVAPYAESHRAGKVARSYVRRVPTTFLSLSAAGRSARPDVAGTFTVDGIRVVHVRAAKPVDAAGPLTPWLNVARTYLPAMRRLVREVRATPSAVVHANGTVLLPLAVLHRWRHGSVVVLEVDEKPGSAALPRSVGVLFRPLEPVVLRLLSRQVDTVVTVTERHRDLLRQGYRFRRHVVARNAPETAHRGTYVDPPSVGPDDPVVFVAVSSIFEGRCFEALIDACALIRARGARVQVRVHGYARPAYLAVLAGKVARHGVYEQIRFLGRVPLSDVADAYSQGHVALSLYEPELAHNDSLPNKVLEAVSVGRPVLATGQPEVERLVASEGVGWLTGSTPEAIADSLESLARDIRSGAVDLPALARHCRRLGDAELSWEHEFEPVLDLVLPQRPAPQQVTRLRATDQPVGPTAVTTIPA